VKSSNVRNAVEDGRLIFWKQGSDPAREIDEPVAEAPTLGVVKSAKCALS